MTHENGAGMVLFGGGMGNNEGRVTQRDALDGMGTRELHSRMFVNAVENSNEAGRHRQGRSRQVDQHVAP